MIQMVSYLYPGLFLETSFKCQRFLPLLTAAIGQYTEGGIKRTIEELYISWGRPRIAKCILNYTLQ